MSTDLFENSVYWESMPKIQSAMKLFCSEGKKGAYFDDSYYSYEKKKKKDQIFLRLETESGFFPLLVKPTCN